MIESSSTSWKILKKHPIHIGMAPDQTNLVNNMSQGTPDSYSLAQKISKMKMEKKLGSHKRPNLETITYNDKEYKINNELKENL